MDGIDYDIVAQLYDLYVGTDYDFSFFLDEVRGCAGSVLELMAGTGRLSVPLIEAGAALTCVDVSRGMLDVLTNKLQAKGLTAEIVCLDVCRIEFESTFDLVIVPFQSFMELIGRDRQAAALSAVYRALKPGGKFICTMHNPAIRRKSIDGVLRIVGQFPKDDETLVVSGFEQGGDPVVMRHQFFEYFDSAGTSMWRRMLPMQFELIEKRDFQAMAEQTGFEVTDLYGHYDRREFVAAESPVMIWVLRK